MTAITRKSRVFSIVFWSILCVVWVAFIFSNSLKDGIQSGANSQSVLAIINRFLENCHIPIQFTSFFVRKAAHFTEFAILGILLTKESSLFFSAIQWQLIAFPFGFLCACCDEGIQRFQEGRCGQWSDVLIDSCGVLFGCLALQLVFRLIRKRKEKKQKAG